MQDARIWQVQTEICLHFACSKRKEKCRVHRIDSIQPKLITSTCFIFSSIPWSVSLSEIRTSNNLKWHSCDIVRCTTWWGTFRQIIPFTGWWWASYDFCDELVMIRMQNQLWSHWVVLVYHGDEFTKSECDFFFNFSKLEDWDLNEMVQSARPWKVHTEIYLQFCMRQEKKVKGPLNEQCPIKIVNILILSSFVFSSCPW